MAKKVNVQLVFCPTCPTLEPTRKVLLQALSEFGQEKFMYSETNVHAPENPPELQHWPSPAILINGKEFEGIVQNPDQPCRLFENESNYPNRKKLILAFRNEQTSI